LTGSISRGGAKIRLFIAAVINSPADAAAVCAIAVAVIIDGGVIASGVSVIVTGRIVAALNLRLIVALIGREISDVVITADSSR
jgi:hypothetical protein